jgi:hypothetical protein
MNKYLADKTGHTKVPGIQSVIWVSAEDGGFKATLGF